MVILLHFCQENDTQKQNELNINYIGNISVNNTEQDIHLVMIFLFRHCYLLKAEFRVYVT